jgi:hypothetical protein
MRMTHVCAHAHAHTQVAEAAELREELAITQREAESVAEEYECYRLSKQNFVWDNPELQRLKRAFVPEFAQSKLVAQLPPHLGGAEWQRSTAALSIPYAHLLERYRAASLVSNPTAAADGGCGMRTLASLGAGDADGPRVRASIFGGPSSKIEPGSAVGFARQMSRSFKMAAAAGTPAKPAEGPTARLPPQQPAATAPSKQLWSLPPQLVQQSFQTPHGESASAMAGGRGASSQTRSAAAVLRVAGPAAAKGVSTAEGAGVAARREMTVALHDATGLPAVAETHALRPALDASELCHRPTLEDTLPQAHAEPEVQLSEPTAKAADAAEGARIPGAKRAWNGFRNVMQAVGMRGKARPSGSQIGGEDRQPADSLGEEVPPVSLGSHTHEWRFSPRHDVEPRTEPKVTAMATLGLVDRIEAMLAPPGTKQAVAKQPTKRMADLVKTVKTIGDAKAFVAAQPAPTSSSAAAAAAAGAATASVSTVQPSHSARRNAPAVLRLGTDAVWVPPANNAVLIVDASRVRAAVPAPGFGSKPPSARLVTEPTVFDQPMVGALASLSFVPAVGKGCRVRHVREPLLAMLVSETLCVVAPSDQTDTDTDFANFKLRFRSCTLEVNVTDFDRRMRELSANAELELGAANIASSARTLLGSALKDIGQAVPAELFDGAVPLEKLAESIIAHMDPAALVHDGRAYNIARLLLCGLDTARPERWHAALHELSAATALRRELTARFCEEWEATETALSVEESRASVMHELIDALVEARLVESADDPELEFVTTVHAAADLVLCKGKSSAPALSKTVVDLAETLLHAEKHMLLQRRAWKLRKEVFRAKVEAMVPALERSWLRLRFEIENSGGLVSSEEEDECFCWVCTHPPTSLAIGTAKPAAKAGAATRSSTRRLPMDRSIQELAEQLPAVVSRKGYEAIVRKAVTDVLPTYENCLRTGRPPKDRGRKVS